MPAPRPLRPVVSYPRDTVLDKHQLAAGLGVCVAIAIKADLPFTMIGGRPKWIWGQVLDVLAERALPSARPYERAAAERSVRKVG
jgi:hypothetical protein